MTARRWLRSSQRALWACGVVIALLVLWEGSIRLFAVPNYVLPPIESVVSEFLLAPAFFLNHAIFTLTATVLGFGLAVIIGVLMAVGIVSSRVLENVFLTILALVHSLPKIALAPLFVLWLGTDMLPKIVIAALAAIFVIVIDVVVGMQSVDPEMVNMARAKRASASQILFKIKFPHALPNLFGALKAAVSFALIGALVGEFVGGQRGLGYVILVAQGNFDTSRAFAAILLLGIIGTALFYAVAVVETVAVPWHVSQRTRSARR